MHPASRPCLEASTRSGNQPAGVSWRPSRGGSRLASRVRAGFAVLMGTFAACCAAAELRIAAPNAVKESLTEIAVAYERTSGHRLVFAWTGSEAISKRVGEGEVFDVVVNTSQGIERLARDGKLAVDSKTDFARSGVGVAVRAGSPRPDVSTVESLRQSLLGAGSIAISSGPSGRYLEALFQQLGVAEQIQRRIKQPPSGMQISEMLARGEADLGFQQITELLHASGISYLGPLPAAVQHHTVWSAAIHAAAPQADAARGFLRMLRAPDALPAIRKSGMDPI